LTVRESSRQIANSKLQDEQSAMPGKTGDAAPNTQYRISSIQVAWGDVRVVSRATGYRILRRTTNEVLGFGQIDLPEQVLETQACWLAFPQELIERLRAIGAWVSDPNEYGPSWPAQRDAARARDGFRCQGCGAAEPAGRQHDVHHRVPFRAFLADSGLRGNLPVELAWQAANRLENLVTLCTSCHRQAEASVRIRSGLGGVAALLAGIAPLHLMCDPADLGVVVEPADPRTKLPTITIYEKAPGGVGYAEQLFASMPDVLRAGLDLVGRCPCEHGCPGCVGPAPEHEYALDTKALASALLAKCLV
jgi:DEAD/DEAH box helicase domain-containing protein